MNKNYNGRIFVDVDQGVGGVGADAFDMYQMNDSSESEPVLALLHDDLDLDAVGNQTFSPYVIDGYNETGNWTGWVSNDANQTQHSLLDRKFLFANQETLLMELF